MVDHTDSDIVCLCKDLKKDGLTFFRGDSL